MKKLLCIFFISYAAFAYSQPLGEMTHPIKDYKTHGYIDGIRLDSLNAGFARIGWRDHSVFFDYGQGVKAKEMLITDKEGLRLTYAKSGIIFWMNFFYFNGWEYVPDSSTYLLRKRLKVNQE